MEGLLRTTRLAQRRSQAEVAAAAGIVPHHLSVVERGLVRPNVDTLLRLCRVLGLTEAERTIADLIPLTEPEAVAS